MLAALALRRAVVELLTSKTIAGTFVYDTRLDELDIDDVRDRRAVISVYTEEDEANPYHARETYPSDTTVAVVVETMILTTGEAVVVNGDGSEEKVQIADIADSDAYSESLLDVMSYQVRRRMAFKDQDQATEVYAAIAMEIKDVRSYPQRTPDKATRIAGRSIHFRIKVKTDQDAAPGALPEPLASVAARLTLQSSAAIIGGIPARLVAPAKADQLQGITVNTAVDTADPVTSSVTTI